MIDHGLRALYVREGTALFISGAQRNHAARNQLAEVVARQRRVVIAADHPIAIHSVFIDHAIDGCREDRGRHAPTLPAFAFGFEVQRPRAKTQTRRQVVLEDYKDIQF